MLVSSTSARLNAGYIYASCGYGESTTDLVWAGSTLIYENGSLLAENERFSRESSIIYADIDVERLDTVRAKNPNFRDALCDRSESYSTVDGGPAFATDFGKKLYKTNFRAMVAPKIEATGEKIKSITSNKLSAEYYYKGE